MDKNIKTCCKDCKERTYKCHSSCPKYAEFQKQNEEKKRALYKRQEELNDYLGVKFKGLHRTYRKKRK